MSSSARPRPAQSIRGEVVPPLLPESGAVSVWCVGEAPGPRGADKSGIPFFGDRAGLPLYRALVAAGVCVLPMETWTLPWDGTRLREAGITPRLQHAAVGNAYPVCPTDDGIKFRAPTKRELESAHNMARLVTELEQLRTRGLRAVLALGHVAARTMELLLTRVSEQSVRANMAAIVLHTLPHPSAQGLLSAAPNRGRGAQLATLAAQWEAQLAAVIRAHVTDAATTPVRA